MIFGCLVCGRVRGTAEPQLPPDRSRFSIAELQPMHCYCLNNRDLVRRGSTPTKDQDDKFMALQKVLIGEAVTA